MLWLYARAVSWNSVISYPVLRVQRFGVVANALFAAALDAGAALLLGIRNSTAELELAMITIFFIGASERLG